MGDIAVNGNLVYAGVAGMAFCLTPENRVAWRPGPHQVKTNWTGYRTVLCAGPRLLTQGEVLLNGRAEGFHDPRVFGSAPRSALAWRPDGVLIFLTIQENISLRNLAYVCQHLGASEAMALDGGSSSGLYAEGRTLTRPGRSLSNLLLVYTSRQRFQQYAARLAPAARQLARLLPDMPPVSTATFPAETQTAAPAPSRPAKCSHRHHHPARRHPTAARHRADRH